MEMLPLPPSAEKDDFGAYGRFSYTNKKDERMFVFFIGEFLRPRSNPF